MAICLGELGFLLETKLNKCFSQDLLFVNPELLSPLFLHSSANIDYRPARGAFPSLLITPHGFSHHAQVEAATVLTGRTTVMLNFAKLPGSVSKLCDSL